MLFSGGSKLASTSEADKKVDVKMEVGANAAEGTTAEGLHCTNPC